MAQEHFIFRALRQQLLWPSIHAAVDVYQRRRASGADNYELIWRLIHICECTEITLASAAIARIRDMGKDAEFLKLRERCYGITWNATEVSLEKGPGALDGSIDKWIEIIHYIASCSIEGSKFVAGCQSFLLGPKPEPSSANSEFSIDLAPLVRAWSRACDVPPNVQPERVSVKDAFQAINSFRNRFAHVPFPYDQLQEVCRELEFCVFKFFEIPPTAANDESPLSGSFGLDDSLLRGAGYRNTPDSWQQVDREVFVWGKGSTPEVWDARPFVFLDKMMRPYLLNRLKNEAGSWEYIRYLAEANAVYGINDPDLLKLLPRPSETEYRTHKEEEPIAAQLAASAHDGPSIVFAPPAITTREQAIAAVRERDFEPAIDFWRKEVEHRPYYHSGWQRLGFAQREYGVDLTETDREAAERLLQESVVSFTHATSHSDPQYQAEAFYNRSKAHWRLWRLNQDCQESDKAVSDAQAAAARFYDHKFISWCEFLGENPPKH